MPAPELTATRSTHRKFLWIRQVCADPQLRHLPCRIAALMLDYINLKSQVAWPSQQTLPSSTDDREQRRSSSPDFCHSGAALLSDG